MRVYLAGKIAEVDWRHEIVFNLKEHVEAWKAGTWWPTVERSIFGTHDYVGPYFRKVEKSIKEAYGLKPHHLCLDAIERADLVYAWVDDPTAYATIYEMGYAKKAGKRTVIAYPKGMDHKELWFMFCCSDELIEISDPVKGLQVAILKQAARLLDTREDEPMWSDPTI